MSTVPAEKTNRLLIAIALLSGAGMLALFFLVYFRQPPTPQTVDIAPLKKDLSDIQAANKQLADALQKIVQADTRKDTNVRTQTDTQVKALNAELAKLSAAFEDRLKELQRQQKEAGDKGDSALAEQVKESARQQREQLEVFKKQLGDYKVLVAQAADKKEPPPPPPAPIVPTPTDDKSEQGQEIVKGILRIGLMVAILSNPELAPILMAIANEMGLFGNGEPEVRIAYMKAVQDVAEGRPISADTRRVLAEAGRQGKIPSRMIEHLDALLGKVPGGDKERGPLGMPTWGGPKSRPDGEGVVADLTRRLREKPTPDRAELLKMFPTASGKPYYSSKAEKTKVEKLFETDYFDRKADLWDGPEGLGAIAVKE